jgi:hypothetical protein
MRAPFQTYPNARKEMEHSLTLHNQEIPKGSVVPFPKLPEGPLIEDPEIWEVYQQEIGNDPGSNQ